MRKDITAVSLFAGAGGLDAGFEQAGYRIVFSNEFDHDAAETWRENRPDSASVMVEGDINEHLEELRPFNGKVDVLFGGPPCQGFSVAGKMDPDDPRSKLIWSFLEAASIVLPKVFVMENVKALGELSKWRAVREKFVEKAAELGYSVEYAVHHAYDFGVPQNRDRVIFVGVRDDDPEKFARALEEQKVDDRPTAREAILSAGAYDSIENPKTCTAVVRLAQHPVMRKSPYAGMLVNGAGRPINLDGLPPTLPATMGGNKTPIVDQRALEDPTKANWFESYHESLENGEQPAKVEVPPYIRRLTVAEAASIQTFPVGYRFHGAKTKQYKQIGNAVPSRFAKAIGNAVREAYFSEE